MTYPSAVFGDPLNFTLPLDSYSNLRPDRFLIRFSAGKSGANANRIAMACNMGQTIKQIVIRLGSQTFCYTGCNVESYRPGSTGVAAEVSYTDWSSTVRR